MTAHPRIKYGERERGGFWVNAWIAKASREYPGSFHYQPCHSEPKAKKPKTLGKDLVLVFKGVNTDNDFRPFTVAQGDKEKSLGNALKPLPFDF